MDAWPASLPQLPDRQNFERTPKPSVISFGTEVGPDKRRRRSAARTIPVTQKFTITQSQIPTFEAFFQTTLADGSLPFAWTDPVIGDAGIWRFDVQDPYSLVPVSGATWSLTIKLERMP